MAANLKMLLRRWKRTFRYLSRMKSRLRTQLLACKDLLLDEWPLNILRCPVINFFARKLKAKTEQNRTVQHRILPLRLLRRSVREAGTVRCTVVQYMYSVLCVQYCTPQGHCASSRIPWQNPHLLGPDGGPSYCLVKTGSAKFPPACATIPRVV